MSKNENRSGVMIVGILTLLMARSRSGYCPRIGREGNFGELLVDFLEIFFGFVGYL